MGTEGEGQGQELKGEPRAASFPLPGQHVYVLERKRGRRKQGAEPKARGAAACADE